MPSVWILGATGRSGRAVAARLTQAGLTTVLVGRSAERLAQLGTGEPLVASDIATTAALIRARKPTVVFNTVGPFARTAEPIVSACIDAGSHYCDLANDVVACSATLGRHAEAATSGSTIITGAGFGFVGTEAVVAALCQGRPIPRSVRVDAIPALAMQAGKLGEALAASIIEGVPDGGRRYVGNRLTRTRLGAGVVTVTLPDGAAVTCGEVPLGDLHAAWLASKAPAVRATSSEFPTALPVRLLLPVAGLILSIGAARRFAIDRLADVEVKPKPAARAHTWGHAVVEWPDGATREGWLRAGDASDFTAGVATAVARRLATESQPAGAFTPIACFGADLVTEAGGELLV